MEKIIIYGAGRTGRRAYEFLENKYECLFFVDKDSQKWGETYCGKTIWGPDKLKDKEYEAVKVVIASMFYIEIMQEIKCFGRKNIEVFEEKLVPYAEEELCCQLNERTIDLGAFLSTRQEMECRELTFMTGGSLILDYVFLREVARAFSCREYLEIGTYIGESINIVSDCCEKLYSITAPPDAVFSMKNWCKRNNMPDYSERLTYSDRITHYYMDSKDFDFMPLGDKIDLYFIDGDHCYNGVLCDTANIFKVKKESAIVIWHDFKDMLNQYNPEVVHAVRDVLNEKFENVYVTNNNMCGIYLPGQYKEKFALRRMEYEENAPLYTYDVLLRRCAKNTVL